MNIIDLNANGTGLINSVLCGFWRHEGLTLKIEIVMGIYVRV